jgi:hypothetical protein
MNDAAALGGIEQARGFTGVTAERAFAINGLSAGQGDCRVRG